MTCLSYSAKDPDEVEVYGLDMTAILGGDAITACTFDLELVGGASDPAPLTKVGSADVSAAPIVRQKVSGGTAGNTYRVKATCTTSGGRTIVASALLAVREGAC